MRITILAHGSRGDIQPYLALGLGLARAGYQVRLAAPHLFREMIETRAAQEGQPLTFAPLSGDPQQLMRTAAAPSLLWKVLPGPVRMALTVKAYLAPVINQLIHDSRSACQDADLVMTSLLTSVIGHQIARERGVPDIAALLFPVFTPTEAFPNPLFGPWPGWMRHLGQRAGSFGPRYNYLTHREFNRVFYYANHMVINQQRKKNPRLLAPLNEWPFGRLEVLPPETCPSQPTPLIYGISHHALGCPAGWQTSENDLPEHPMEQQRRCLQLTGYWFLDAQPGWQPPDRLARFLENGPPPVLISFGSLIPHDARSLGRMAVEALRQSGQRGILLSGWGGMKGSDLPGSVFAVDELPYDWLFPHLAAAVHHGGMGTSAAALRAGIPSVVVPFTFDQPFWGRQMHALGAGPRPIAPDHLSARRLAAAIRAAVEDASMGQRAAELGQHIRAEDGVARAVELVNQVAAGR